MTTYLNLVSIYSQR